MLRHDLAYARQPNPRPLDVARVLGTVESVQDMPQGGYITVQKGFLFHKDLYIPVSAVQNTDADGNVQLSLYKDDLQGDRYDNPPTGGTGGMVNDDTINVPSTRRSWSPVSGRSRSATSACTKMW